MPSGWNTNQIPWNADGQPISQQKQNKNNINNNGGMFWDDVIGMPTRVNGAVNQQQQQQVMNARKQQQRGSGNFK